jgi:hypothetical protein
MKADSAIVEVEDDKDSDMFQTFIVPAAEPATIRVSSN